MKKFHTLPSKVLLPLILIAAATVRLYELGRESLWYDGLYGLWLSRLPISELLPESIASGHPPLYYLVNHFLLMLGEGNAWFRMLSVIAGIFTVWLSYLICVEMFSRRTAIWAAVFTAFSPYLVRYSRESTAYSTWIAVYLLAVYFLIKAVKNGGAKLWAAYIVATLLAFSVHYFSISLIPVSIVIYLFVSEEKGWGRPEKVATAILVPVAMLIPLMAYQGAGGLASKASFDTDLLEFFFREIVTAPRVVLQGVPFNFHNMYMILFPSFFVGVVGLIVLYVRKLRDRKYLHNLYAIILVATIILFSSIAMFAATGDTTGSYRFYGCAVPFAMIIGACLISTLSQKSQILAGLFFLSMTVYVGLIPVLNETKWDMEGVMGTISQLDEIEHIHEEDCIVLCFPLHHCVVAADAYLNKSRHMSGGYIARGEIFLMPPGFEWSGYRSYDEYWGTEPTRRIDVDRILKSEMNGYGHLWLVEGNGYQYPRVEIVQQLLAEGWTLKGEWDYSPYVLKEYDRR